MKTMIATVLFSILFVWLMPLGIELAWNTLVPSLFHGPAMTYQQAGAAFLLIIFVAVIFEVIHMKKWS